MRGEHPDWGTLIFDFGRPEVRNFLVANALYWCDQFHADGLRVDAVASMLYLDYSRKAGQWRPNAKGGRENLDAISFLQEMNATVYRKHPGVTTIAEESTAFSGVTQPTDADGLGFGFKWNMGWMHDTLSYISREPIHRQYHHPQMTFAGVYAFSENYVLPISHDEVVHGKRSLLTKAPGDWWQRLATLRALLRVHVGVPGQAVDLHGLRAGRRPRMERGRRPAVGPAGRPGPRRGPAGAARPQHDLPRHAGAVDAGHQPRPASGGSTPTTPRATRSPSCGTEDSARFWPALSISRPSRTRGTVSDCPRPAAGAR